MEDTIILISDHKVLTFGFCFEYESTEKGTLDFSQRLLIQFVTPVWYCSLGNRGKTALRSCSFSGIEKVSSLHLVFLLSSDDAGPWDPRDPLAVESSPCPSTFQDLAELQPLEAEAAPASKAATRTSRPSTACSTFEIFFVIDATGCVSDKILFSNLVNRCASI